MNTKIKLTITLDCIANDEGIDLHSIDRIEGESMVEVLSKFLILIAMLAPKLAEFRKRNDMDLDIPF